MKDFETLQKTDPEAALEKLNKLEKERAEERASLRHRNTGKWARGQAIRAKFDREVRSFLCKIILYIVLLHLGPLHLVVHIFFFLTLDYYI